jgi:hypothetical protein
MKEDFDWVHPHKRQVLIMTEHNPPPVERRLSDRRTSQRDGKYDRRKNICGLCRYYQPQDPHQGDCLKHDKTVGYQDFACTLFAQRASNIAP